jgi:DNA primase
MYPDSWQKHSHVALCGVSPQAMQWMLEQNPDIQEIALCLDNDAAGIAATERLTETLQQAGYDNVSCLLPDYKDWNEQLVASFHEQPEEELAMSM